MHILSSLKPIRSTVFTASAFVCSLTFAPAQNTEYFFNVGADPIPGWFDAGVWALFSAGPFEEDWQNGSTSVAVIGDKTGANTVQISSDIELNGLEITGPTNANRWILDGSDREITFSGTTPYFAGGHTEVGSGISFQGDVSIDMTNNGHRLTFIGAGPSAYEGLMTINTGDWVRFQNGGRLSADSHFSVNGPSLQFNGGTYDFGSVVMTSGQIYLRVNGTDVRVNNLSGSGGSIFGFSNTETYTFRVNHADGVNEVFSGSVDGSNLLSFIKEGAGGLTLAGDIDLRQKTTVAGGVLLVNSATTSFNGGSSDAAIEVGSGAWFGGTGTITTGLNGDVVLLSGGGLIAGGDAVAGTTSFALHSDAVLDLSAATGSGWLKFDLGSDADAGVTYDQILLTSGTLVIDGLEFNDFAFSLLAGFGPGTYDLFQTDGILGNLGDELSGVLNGNTATLELSGDSIVLTVIPEPASVAAVLGFFCLGLLVIRRVCKASLVIA